MLIHIADPVAFFEPLDRFNERWEELHEHPDWHFYPTRPHGDLAHPDFPSFDELMEQFESLIRRHPGTNFIGAHVGCYAENLHWVGRVMDDCPNFYADISARIAELGRQPLHRARLLHQAPEPDRLWHRSAARSRDVPDLLSLPGNARRILQLWQRAAARRGPWQIYGVDLPDEVLHRIYFDNANELIFKGALTSDVGLSAAS